MTVNLNKCRKGDVLISKHGRAFFYGHKDKSRPYPHIIYDSISKVECSRINNGQVYKTNRLPEDHDIFKVIHLPDFGLRVVNGKVRINEIEYKDLAPDMQLIFNEIISMIRVSMVANPVEN